MSNFYFGKETVASVNKSLDKKTIELLFEHFSIGLTQIALKNAEEHIFRIGDIELPVLKPGKEFVLRVNERGIAIVGRDEKTLMRGILVLVQNINLSEEGIAKVLYCELEGDYCLSNRMIHFCFFPETDFYFLKKMIRFAGMCQYTHVILEFWGTLKFDCLRELAWPDAISRVKAKELIDEIRNFGMEPVPMINSLGHASFSRVGYGKHVVLDQNPRLQYLFTPDGWVWNIDSPKANALLAEIRKELYELFGEGEYIHIGCDEAYYYSFCDEKRKKLPAYLAKLTGDVEKENRRPMVWMDMFLEREKYKECYTAGHPGEEDELINSLSPKTVLVDWQYDVRQEPVESLKHLSAYNYDVMGAPWLRTDNQKAHIETLKKYDMFGVMLTTWHTLKAELPFVYTCAQHFNASFEWAKYSFFYEASATLLRKLSFEGNDYISAGWAREQIDV